MDLAVSPLLVTDYTDLAALINHEEEEILFNHTVMLISIQDKILSLFSSIQLYSVALL